MMDGRRRRREKEKIRGTEEAVKILFLSYSIPPSPPPVNPPAPAKSTSAKRNSCLVELLLQTDKA
jgi:hypothetical protein